MSKTVDPKFAPYLMILAGGFFFLAGAVGLFAKQFVFASFFGIGVMFLALGVSKLKVLKQDKE